MGQRIQTRRSSNALWGGYTQRRIHHCQLGHQNLPLQQHFDSLFTVGDYGKLCGF